MSVWGEVKDGADVEAAVIAHLRHWLPATTARVRKAKDPEAEIWPDGVAEIQEFSVSHADAAAQKWPEDSLPMLVVQSPGMEGDPVVEGDGTVSATYGVMVSAIASSVTMADTKELARLYASAARLAIMQAPQLDAGTGEAFAEHVSMGAERNGQVRRGIEGERNVMICSVPFLIVVPSIMTVTGGPITAPDDPEEEVPDWPSVKEGGGSATVDALTEAGFFEEKPD
jgi:hypothetical protein